MFTQKVGVRTATTNNYSLKTNNAMLFKGAFALPRSEKIVESPARKFMKKFFSFVPRIDFLKTFNNRLRINQKNYFPLKLGGEVKSGIKSDVFTRTSFDRHNTQKKTPVKFVLITPKFVDNLKRFKKTKELGRRLSSLN